MELEHLDGPIVAPRRHHGRRTPFHEAHAHIIDHVGVARQRSRQRARPRVPHAHHAVRVAANHQRQRVEATGEGPWLGSFDLASLPQEVHSELGAAQPWWEEDQEAHESTGKADSKRQRLMQKQLEAHVFEPTAVSGR